VLFRSGEGGGSAPAAFAFRPTPVGPYHRRAISGILRPYAGPSFRPTHPTSTHLLMSSHLSSSPISRPAGRRLPGTLALGSLLVLSVGAAFAQPAHLVRGQQLVDEITAAQALGVFTGDVNGTTVFLNRYGGSWGSATEPSFIRFLDANAGTYAANLTTCAPLVTHLLKHTYGWNWKTHGIPNPLQGGAPTFTSSPQSYLYVSAIKHQVGFSQRLLTLGAVQPGDIAARWDVGTDDGHTMIVVAVNAGSAKAYPETSADPNFLPALAGATYTEVTVLDSSSSGHSSDTRLITYNGSTALSGGVGEGVIGVFTNSAGEVIAHTWSLPTSSYTKVSKGVTIINPAWLSGIKSRVKLQGACELVFGRLPALAPVGP